MIHLLHSRKQYNTQLYTIEVFFKDALHLCNGILFNLKGMEILSFAATWMDLENIMLSEISQRKINIR